MTQSRGAIVRRWLRRIWIGAGLVFVAWQVWSMQAHGVGDAVLQSDARVTVTDAGDVLQFRPAHMTSGAAGLVFLPGAMVEPSAYAPLMRAIADAGHPVTLVRLPWRTAPSEGARDVVWTRIAAVMAESPSRRWVLAGHSRGAALAAQYAGAHATSLGGLVLIGTTHPKAASLDALPLAVTKVYGTRDCVADTASMHANARLLPANTRWVPLDGANHSQFGYYGRQLGDCDATMSRELQQAGTRDAVIRALADAGQPVGNP